MGSVFRRSCCGLNMEELTAHSSGSGGGFHVSTGGYIRPNRK